MKLDVIVPTYNRSHLLRLAIRSLLDTAAPDELEITIVVVDNNSTDDTRKVVEELQAGAPRTLRYIHQPLQGSSQSRNAGIAGGMGEVLGFVDDDEQITPEWYRALAREFADPATDFIGGPYLLEAGTALPAWLPPGYNGVLGMIPARARQMMDENFPGSLPGGNAAMRRGLFTRVGTYNTDLGRTGKGLLSEEDADLYRRVLAAGLRGFHVPDFAILHHVPAARLTKRYFRRWCYWRGVSQGSVDRQRPEAVRYLLGVPRYRIREGLAGFGALADTVRRPDDGEAFRRELPFWSLLGFICGRFLTRTKTLYRTGG